MIFGIDLGLDVGEVLRLVIPRGAPVSSLSSSVVLETLHLEVLIVMKAVTSRALRARH